ncbi:hypothetical protein AAHA92_16929 [Salvia divinorum]|uniref:Glutaredoxin domain-containing protein n=1 Tax=Salvia divinorum TaxID=28513 RepID=A0ABD1GYA8_SALDI
MRNSNSVVLYYASLRGRKTYEDCCAFREALKGKAVSLPQVFIKGKYIGGAGEIKKLHKAGELAMLLQYFPITDRGIVCEDCGDARFVSCPNCSESRKVYEGESGKLKRCPGCNENELLWCRCCCP